MVIYSEFKGGEMTPAGLPIIVCASAAAYLFQWLVEIHSEREGDAVGLGCAINAATCWADNSAVVAGGCAWPGLVRRLCQLASRLV